MFTMAHFFAVFAIIGMLGVVIFAFILDRKAHKMMKN
jgi:hypothetical protein